MAFDTHSASAPAGRTAEAPDVEAMRIALHVLTGTMKPKARQRAAEVLESLAAEMAPKPVDLTVVRLRGYVRQDDHRAIATSAALIRLAALFGG